MSARTPAIVDVVRAPETRQRVGYVEAARYLGLNVGTLRSMVHRRTVPHLRLGPRLVVFDRADLDRYLDAHRIAEGTR